VSARSVDSSFLDFSLSSHGVMRTLVTGQQGAPALCPANRAFFLFIGGSLFSSKKILKKLYFLSAFSFFLSLFLSFTHFGFF
jgi:hypothetical protein